MTEENVTNEGQDENSPVIKSIRVQLREEQKARKALEAQLEAVTGDDPENIPQPVDRAEVERQVRLELHAKALDIPDVIHDQLAAELADQEITEESVQEAYAQLGFHVGERQDAQAQRAAQTAQHLDEVASFGNQIAQAATNQPGSNLTDKINAAETPEELAQIMAEAGQS